MPRPVLSDLRIFDVGGRLIRTMLHQALAPGSHSLRWDARDAHAAPVPAGGYYLVLRTGGERLARPVVVTR